MIGQTVSVEAVAQFVKRRFRVEMDIHEVIENSAECLKKMGLLRMKKSTEVYMVKNFCTKLPPEVYTVKSVIQMGNYVYPTDITIQEIWHPPSLTLERSNEVRGVEDLIANNGETNQTLNEQIAPNYLKQIKGVYTDFVWECPYVRVNYTDYPIAVEQVSILTDDEGLPLIPEEALNACGYYCMYVLAEPMLIAGKIPEYVYARVEDWKNKHINQAKNENFFKNLSKNEADKIFDILASFDRKRVNIDN